MQVSTSEDEFRAVMPPTRVPLPRLDADALFKAALQSPVVAEQPETGVEAGQAAGGFGVLGLPLAVVRDVAA